MKTNKFADYEKVLVTGRLRVCLEFAKKQKLKNKVILDVGCANGLLAYLLKREKAKKYIGADPSASAITYAKKHMPQMQSHVAPAASIPVRASSADVAFMFDVIEHVPKNGEVKALTEIARILKRGGKLILSTPHNHFLTNMLDPAWYFGHRHYQKKQIESFLKKSGFAVKSIEVRGGLWFSIYLILLYFSKWVFGNPEFSNKFIQDMDDKQFSKAGIHTIYAVAEKL